MIVKRIATLFFVFLTIGFYVIGCEEEPPPEDQLPPRIPGKIVFCCDYVLKDDFDYNYTLWTVNTDGSDLEEIVYDMNYRCCRTMYFKSNHLSPNGLYLAYSHVTEDSAGIKIIDTNLNLMNEVTFISRSVCWHPDSSHLIAGVYYNGIHRVGIDGSSEKIFNSKYMTFDHDVAYSPDASKIAFVHHEYGHNYYIQVIDSDGSNLEIVDDYNSYGGTEDHDEQLYLQWSVDGKNLFYKLKGLGLIAVNLENQSSEIVIGDNDIKYFKFNSKGDKLVYISIPENDPNNKYYPKLFLVDTNNWEEEMLIPNQDIYAYDFDWIDSTGDIVFNAYQEMYYIDMTTKKLFQIPLDLGLGEDYRYSLGTIEFSN